MARILDRPNCPASGLMVDANEANGDHLMWCPTCSRWVTAEPVDVSQRVLRVEDHRPRMNPEGKTGIHGPACVDHDADECICSATHRAPRSLAEVQR